MLNLVNWVNLLLRGLTWRVLYRKSTDFRSPEVSVSVLFGSVIQSTFGLFFPKLYLTILTLIPLLQKFSPVIYRPLLDALRCSHGT